VQFSLRLFRLDKSGPGPSEPVQGSWAVAWTPLLIRTVLNLTAKWNETLARAREGNPLPLWGFVRAESCRMSGSYYQKWRPTNQHRFPTKLLKIPLESREVKETWKALSPEGSTFFNAYLMKLAIGTKHVEAAFLLTEEVCFL